MEQLSMDLDTLQGQNGAILRYLEEGNVITPLDALRRFRCNRLAARVHDLRKRGFKIQTRFIEDGEKRFASYFLAKDAG